MSEGLYSREIEKAQRIDRFGLEAVTGRRVLLHHEFLCIRTAENIVNAYRMREKSSNWVEWTESNPQAAQILADVEKLLED